MLSISLTIAHDGVECGCLIWGGSLSREMIAAIREEKLLSHTNGCL